MSIAYRIDKKFGITYVLWKGDVAGYDFLDHVQRLTSDPDWPGSRSFHIADLRDAILEKSIDHIVLEEAATYYGNYLHNIATMKAAIVVTNEVEKARFFAGFVSQYGPTVKVFKNIDEALLWLGIDAKEAKSVFEELRIQPEAGR